MHLYSIIRYLDFIDWIILFAASNSLVGGSALQLERLEWVNIIFSDLSSACGCMRVMIHCQFGVEAG